MYLSPCGKGRPLTIQGILERTVEKNLSSSCGWSSFIVLVGSMDPCTVLSESAAASRHILVAMTWKDHLLKFNCFTMLSNNLYTCSKNLNLGKNPTVLSVITRWGVHLTLPPFWDSGSLSKAWEPRQNNNKRSCRPRFYNCHSSLLGYIHRPK